MTVPRPTSLDILEESIRGMREREKYLETRLSDKKAELTRVKLLLHRILRNTKVEACSDSEAWSMAEDVVDGRT